MALIGSAGSVASSASAGAPLASVRIAAGRKLTWRMNGAGKENKSSGRSHGCWKQAPGVPELEMAYLTPHTDDEDYKAMRAVSFRLAPNDSETDAQPRFHLLCVYQGEGNNVAASAAGGGKGLKRKRGPDADAGVIPDDEEIDKLLVDASLLPAPEGTW